MGDCQPYQKNSSKSVRCRFTFDILKRRAKRLYNEGFEVPTRNFAVGFQLLTALEERILRDGWRPSTIKKLRGKPDSCLLYFVSNLEGPSPTKSHKRCVERQCLANQIDESTYLTIHICEDGKYGEIHVDKKDLFEILKSGAIPLISFDPDRKYFSSIPSSR